VKVNIESFFSESYTPTNDDVKNGIVIVEIGNDI